MLDTLLGLAPQANDGWMNKDPSDPYWYGPRGAPTVAGIDVSPESAMQLTTVHNCVTKLAKTIATLPAHVYERTGPKDSKPIDHPLNEIFSSRANAESTGTTFRESMMGNGLLWGNQYARIIKNNRGDLDSLRLLQASDTKPMRRPSGEVVFEHRPDGAATPETIPADEVLHVPNFSINGIIGLSPIALNRAAIALGQACVDFGSAVFGNGAWASGFIKGAPNSTGKNGLSKDAAKEVIASMNEQFQGARKAFGVGLLRGDMEFEQLKMPGEDLEFLLTRQFQRVEICGMFDVPLSKIQDLDKATFSNVEQQDLGWAKDAIVPWVVRLEMAIKKAFFQGTNLFFKINVDGLMRGDFKSRMEGFAIGRQWGIYSINDTRALLDMPPIQHGDDHLIPMNMDIVGQPRIGRLSSVPPQEPKEPEEAPDDSRAQAPVDMVEAFRPAVEDAARRVATKEIKAVANAMKRLEKGGDRDKFVSWACQFYSDHVSFSQQIMGPITKSFSGSRGCDPVVLSVNIATVCESHAEKNLTTFSSGDLSPVTFSELAGPFQVATASELTNAILTAFSQALQGDSDEN